MIELAVIVIMLIAAGIAKLLRAAGRLSVRERESVEMRRRCGYTGFCRAYGIAKAGLTLIAVGAIFYIFVSLAIGETVGLRHMFSAKFWKIAGGCAVILLPHALLRGWKK